MDLPVNTRSAGEGHLQLWGGVECTINRVGDRYCSQLERSAHLRRTDDLDRFAALGIKAIRYPVLWEQIAPGALRYADWSWPDERLARLRALKLRPILGLVHHGSGPQDTSLVDPAFPAKLARYAGAVAARYPWVEDYTPVNEPLTTARFSGLYGLWYPHGRNEATFKTVLLNQCRAIVLAMREIENVNPNARLVQTDDLGKSHGTPALAYQVTFNNELRWLAWDLLCGRVDRHHYLWEWLIKRCSATPEEILWFGANPRPPDIVGANYYVTSERFLDEDLEKYPPHFRGGNGRHGYADVEAARVLSEPRVGIAPLLLEAWKRFGIPIAVTEAHISATREDQLRWLVEMWAGAKHALSQGADVRAVTAWALLGSYDWNCLLTETRGHYESGAFDVRGHTPRPTAVAELMKSLARDSIPAHPVLAGRGWWHRSDRYIGSRTGQFVAESGRDSFPSILITGATGTLGNAFARICNERDLDCCRLSRAEMDIADEGSIERSLELHKPWAVVNAAGYVRVDEAERDAERCFRENTLGPSMLAASCARHGLPLMTFSSDLVFDGGKINPYIETDRPAPLSIYGESKAQAESLVLQHHPNALVVRTSSFFGPWDQHNFLTVALRRLRAGDEFVAASDVVVSPTYVPDLVHACLDLLIDGESGIWHLTNGHAISWADLAAWAARLTQVDAGKIQRCKGARLRLLAKRPYFSALTSTRCFAMPPLEDALKRYVASSLISFRQDESKSTFNRGLELAGV